MNAPALEITSSHQFTPWLAQTKLSLAFTTDRANKVFWIGLQLDGQLSVFERTFERCRALWAHGSSLYLSTLYQLWRFENALEPGEIHNGYDRFYVPQVSYITGDLNIHDVAVADPPLSTQSGHQVIFVNTLFSCLATVSEQHSFVPLWQPSFISQLAPEERCHLNGLAMQDGHPRYVTAASQTDVPQGWRDKQGDGGCVIDISSNEVIVTGLSMPHSPRWYRDKLWLLNSGTGEFGYVDLKRGTFEPITFCPGYLRGCAFCGDFAIVGVSKPRYNHIFSGLPLEETLRINNAQPYCGLLVIDLKTGNIVHSLKLEGVVQEVYDVVALPGVQSAMAIGIQTDEIHRVVTLG